MKRRYVAPPAFPGPLEALCTRPAYGGRPEGSRRTGELRYSGGVSEDATAEEVSYDPDQPSSSFRVASGSELACARIDTPACWSTWSFVKLVISVAMFTSSSALTAEVRFWL